MTSPPTRAARSRPAGPQHRLDADARSERPAHLRRPGVPEDQLEDLVGDVLVGIRLDRALRRDCGRHQRLRRSRRRLRRYTHSPGRRQLRNRHRPARTGDRLGDADAVRRASGRNRHAHRRRPVAGREPGRAGTYTSVLDPQGAATGSATLALYDVPADASGSVGFGGPSLTISTATPGQNARITFDGRAGQHVSLKFSGVTVSLSYVSILKPDGGTLVAPTYVMSNGRTFTLDLPADGTYAVVIDPQGAATGSMTLSLF